MSDAPTPVAGVPAGGSDGGVSGAAANPSSGGAPSDSQEADFISPEEFAKLSRRKVKHKVDGKEAEITLEEALRGYSHSQAANKRFEEAATERKRIAQERQEMEQQLARLKDPKAVREVLKQHLGEDGFSRLAHETVAEALRREAMTPEEIQAEQDARELEEYRNSKKQEAEARQKQERQQKVEKFTEDIATDLEEFLQRTGKTAQPHEMESLLGMMLNALEEGYDLSLDDAWHFVQKQESTRFERYLNQVDVTQLPKEFVEKVRKHSVSSLPMRGGQRTESPRTQSKVDEGVDAQDFFRKMRNEQ